MYLIKCEMNPETEKLLATLEVVSEGLWYSSESDYSYVPFVWDSRSQGEFSIVNVLEHLGYFQVVEHEWLNQYWQNIQQEAKSCKQTDFDFSPIYPKNYEIQRMHERSLHFFELFKENLYEIQIIKFSASMLIVGKTQEEDWVGVSPRFNYGSWHPHNTIHPEVCPSTTASINLKTTLTPLLSEIKFLHGYSWSDLVWENAVTKKKLLLKLLLASNNEGV